MRALVIGGGVFGVTAALELRARGLDVVLADPGPLPHPLAESTDISKVVRSDYGADEGYTILGERALDGWRRWNAEWPVPRFHETGVAFLTRTPMPPGGFEHASFELLARRGHHIERLDAAAIARRFPAYRPGAYVDGYYHREAGWAESGAAVAQLVELARGRGVAVREHCAIDRIVDDGALAGDERLAADAIVVCAGSWVPALVPELAGSLRAVGQPGFHLRPADPSLFEAARFPVFGADISRTGFYGFPVNRDGIVKVANHGTGVAMGPDDDRSIARPREARMDESAGGGPPLRGPGVAREVLPAHEQALRAMLADSFPALATAPIVGTRLCVYCDTLDGHFWIARDPARPHVAIATGGSGHAFKFAPVLGELIADAVLGAGDPKFGWRPALDAQTRGDAARSEA